MILFIYKIDLDGIQLLLLSLPRLDAPPDVIQGHCIVIDNKLALFLSVGTSV
jgi:hypothetical protein